MSQICLFKLNIFTTFLFIYRFKWKSQIFYVIQTLIMHVYIWFV